VVEQAPLHKKAEPGTKIELETVGFRTLVNPTLAVVVAVVAHKVVQAGLTTAATAAQAS
jgi:hypothetical protein